MRFLVGHRRNSTLIVSASLVFSAARLVGNTAPNTSVIEDRIKRVENGLLPPAMIKGQKVEPMKLAERMKFYHTPGLSIAAINDGRLEWARGYGAREADGDAVTPDTLFQAASISKPVFAMAALRLVQEGKLDLDEDVNRKLVSWKVPANEFTKNKAVTLRGLLSHTAGLTVHGFNGYERDAPVPTLLQILDGVKPANSEPIRVDLVPDTTYRYSGGGYVVIQQLLLDVTGKDFPAFMQDTILGPIGMAHSSYEHPLPREQWAQAAIGYQENGERVKGDWHIYPEMAPAGLWTTASDLARFAIEIQQSLAGKSTKVLFQEMTKQMLKPNIGGWGLGLEVGGEGSSAHFNHSGGNAGFRCFLFGYNTTGRGAVVMTNSDSGAELGEEILRSIAKEYGWTDYLTKEKVLAHLDSKIYQSYVGQYDISPDRSLNITAEEGRLMVQVTGQARKEIYPESETQFFFTTAPAEMTFLKDAKGQVIELVIEQRGQKFTAKKVK